MNPFDHEVTFSFGISRSKLVDGALDDIFGKDNGEIIDRIDMSNGFEAIAVKNKVTNEVVIASRGSDFEDKGIDWWGQNLSIWQQFKGPQVDDADRFIERVMNNDRAKGSTIILTGHSKGGFHAEDGAKKYGLPAVTFNAPGLKPHPLHKISGWQALKTAINPYMSIFRDPLNALGVYDKRVVNYVNQDDVVGNYGVHFGKVVVTDDGEPPVERNDYLYPNKDQVRTVIARVVKLLREGGTEKFRFEHSLDPFDAHFGREGNIAR